MVKKENEKVLNLYIRKEIQKHFMKYSKDKKITRSGLINELIKLKLAKEGYL